jgi:hypothetical protein
VSDNFLTPFGVFIAFDQVSRMMNVLICLTFAALVQSFVISRPRIVSSNFILKMSDAAEDPLKDLRERMASDPSFDPRSDPRMMEALESVLPESLREMPLALERLNVAFKNAMTGTEAVENLDESVKMFKDEKFISSPQSKWFREGAVTETFSETTKKNLLQSLQQQHPEVKAE